MKKQVPLTAAATVGDYFEEKLGDELQPIDEREPEFEHSPYHPSFHIDTGCGTDCRAAIDAAANVLTHIRKAYGDDRPDLIENSVEVVREVVLCYVYG